MQKYFLFGMMVWGSLVAFGSVPPPGARPMAMGGAFTAVSDDGNAPFYNPAGVAMRTGVRLAFTRSALFSDVSNPLVVQDSASAAFGVGVGGATLAVSSLADRESIYRETTLGVGYAHAFGERLRIGFLGKFLRVGLDASQPDVAQNPYFADATDVSATTFDVGALGEMTKGLWIGIAAQDILPPHLTFKEATESESFPRRITMGVAFRLGAVAPLAEQEALRGVLERSLVAFDVGAGDGTYVRAGAEIGLSPRLALRTGFRSVSSVSATTFGVGIALGSLSFDLGVEIMNSDLRDNMNQRLSLRATF